MSSKPSDSRKETRTGIRTACSRARLMICARVDVEVQAPSSPSEYEPGHGLSVTGDADIVAPAAAAGRGSAEDAVHAAPTIAQTISASARQVPCFLSMIRPSSARLDSTEEETSTSRFAYVDASNGDANQTAARA